MSIKSEIQNKPTPAVKVIHPGKSHDMTILQQFEEMMLQSEKMMSVGGLAAGMAHEINNILAGVLQNVQVLQHRLSTALPKNKRAAEECGLDLEAMQKYMEKRGIPGLASVIKESSLRAATIVTDMLNFSRMNKANFSTYSVTELLDKTVALASKDYNLKKKYDFMHIRVSREYSPDTPPIPCEAGKIQQVFFNILKNGAEAMHEIDNPKYRPSFTLHSSSAGKYVRVDIRDNGPGMSKEVLDSIFDPFFTTKSETDGTGLGLSVCSFIIAQIHQGKIEVSSSQGKGTTFSIYLPTHH